MLMIVRKKGRKMELVARVGSSPVCVPRQRLGERALHFQIAVEVAPQTPVHCWGFPIWRKGGQEEVTEDVVFVTQVSRGGAGSEVSMMGGLGLLWACSSRSAPTSHVGLHYPWVCP